MNGYDFPPSSDGFPGGLLGAVADYIYRSSHYPNVPISRVAAIGLLAGVAARQFNVSGSGLNQYLMVLAPTGLGKEAMARGTSRLMAKVAVKTPAAQHFRGPGELVSGPGIIKAIARAPYRSLYCHVSEIGLLIQGMSGTNPNPNALGLSSAILKLWPKGGQHNVMDDFAYSDKEKNVGSIDSPALTLICEGVPETLYNALDVTKVNSGFLSRFLIIETNVPRPYINPNAGFEPSADLIDGIYHLVRRTTDLATANSVTVVPLSDEAIRHFAEFERLTTDAINSGSELERKLMIRNYEKAVKLAALAAVGRDFETPEVSIDDALWATRSVVGFTDALITKFNTGDVGATNDDLRRQNEMQRVIRDFLAYSPDRDLSSFGITPAMQNNRVFSLQFLHKRCLKLPTFEGDKRKLHSTIQTLKDDDLITEIDREDMYATYQTRARSFAINPANFPLDK